jgi:TRAP-type mannitol/chloroaromatic compound transport system permease small subunit
VRIDVVAARFSPRTQAWIDIAGTVGGVIPAKAGIKVASFPRRRESSDWAPAYAGATTITLSFPPSRE